MNPPLPLCRREAALVGLAALYFFLSLVSYYILKPVRDALYIHELGAENLPFVYLGQAGLALVLIKVYDVAFNHLSRRRFMLIAYGFLILSLPIFRWLLTADDEWYKAVVVGFHLWVSLFFLTAVALFWSLSNETFSLESGKRYYGWVGAAGPLGGLAGSIITEQAVQLVGTFNLLFVASGVLALCLPIVWWLTARPAVAEPDALARAPAPSLARRAQELPGVPRAPVPVEPQWSPGYSGLRYVAQSRYLASIAGIVCLMNVAAMVYDVQMLTVAEAALPNRDAMTGYLGALYFWINLTGLLIQLLATGPILQRLGPIAGLTLLPLVVAAGAIAVLTVPHLTVLALLFVASGALAYSINQSSKEVLYLPTPADIKYKAKAAIDIFVFRLGDALGAVFMLVMTQVIGVPLRNLAYFSLGLVAAWLLILSQLRRDHWRLIMPAADSSSPGAAAGGPL